MKISTKLRIGYLFSAFIVILAGVIIYISFKQMHITGINLKLVGTLEQNVFELNILGDEYLLYREKRPKIQWQIKHKALGRHLEEVNFHDPDNQSLLNEIIENIKLISTVFSDLVSSHSVSGDIFESELLRQKQNRLKSRMLLESQKVLVTITQLKNQIADELFSIQKYTNWISLTLIMAAALFSLLIEFLISRSIISSIKDLVRGTEKISSGNLEFRLKTDRSDEIGKLSRSFDQMIKNLKKVMVSRDELERRVKERTAELTTSNRQLTSEIKERKQTEEKLKATELKYRTVADFNYDWEYWSNIEDSLEYISPSCERISGYSVQDFRENPALLHEIIVPEDKKSWDTHALKCEKELTPGEIHFQIQRKDGEFRWIEHLCQPVTDSQGTFLGFRASNRDITARKQAELELQRAYNEILSLKEQLEAESSYLQEEIKLEHNFENIIGQSEELKYVLYQVEQVAATDSSVLIMGDTGTGKELVARAIHKLSPRSNRVIVKVNCATLPAELIESELFGREKGAFTGATTTQIGRFELARGSTILLDEIGELPLALQAKLLRVYESGEFERLGSPKSRHSDARIIAATNRDLEEEVRQGRFREDLWYRLKVFTVTMPALRQRKSDIPLLTSWFMDQLSREMGKPPIEISNHTIQTFQDYPWPGNVRELKNMIENALITGRFDKLKYEPPVIPDTPVGNFKSLEDMERDYILLVLKAKNWKIQGTNSASSVLGMNPNTLRARIKKLGIKKLSAK